MPSSYHTSLSKRRYKTLHVRTRRSSSDRKRKTRNVRSTTLRRTKGGVHQDPVVGQMRSEVINYIWSDALKKRYTELIPDYTFKPEEALIWPFFNVKQLIYSYSPNDKKELATQCGLIEDGGTNTYRLDKDIWYPEKNLVDRFNYKPITNSPLFENDIEQAVNTLLTDNSPQYGLLGTTYTISYEKNKHTVDIVTKVLSEILKQNSDEAVHEKYKVEDAPQWDIVIRYFTGKKDTMQFPHIDNFAADILFVSFGDNPTNVMNLPHYRFPERDGLDNDIQRTIIQHIENSLYEKAISSNMVARGNTHVTQIGSMDTYSSDQTSVALHSGHVYSNIVNESIHFGFDNSKTPRLFLLMSRTPSFMNKQPPYQPPYLNREYGWYPTVTFDNWNVCGIVRFPERSFFDKDKDKIYSESNPMKEELTHSVQTNVPSFNGWNYLFTLPENEYRVICYSFSKAVHMITKIMKTWATHCKNSHLAKTLQEYVVGDLWYRRSLNWADGPPIEGRSKEEEVRQYNTDIDALNNMLKNTDIKTSDTLRHTFIKKLISRLHEVSQKHIYKDIIQSIRQRIYNYIELGRPSTDNREEIVSLLENKVPLDLNRSDFAIRYEQLDNLTSYLHPGHNTPPNIPFIQDKTLQDLLTSAYRNSWILHSPL